MAPKGNMVSAIIVALFVTCLPCASTNTAIAADANDHVTYRFMGAGTRTCAQFASDYSKAQTSTEEGFMIWATGFMSGLNEESSEKTKEYRDVSSIPYAQQKQMIRDYCDEHPLKTYLDAVLEMYSHMTMVKSSADH